MNKEILCIYRNELDESQPQFSEDTEASNLRDVASPCSGAASGAAKQQELHCGNATDDIELAARSSSVRIDR